MKAESTKTGKQTTRKREHNNTETPNTQLQMIKYKYEDLDFYVDEETGKLVIDYRENIAVIDNHIAIELIEILRQKLYLHKEQKESVIKRFFK